MLALRCSSFESEPQSDESFSFLQGLLVKVSNALMLCFLRDGAFDASWIAGARFELGPASATSGELRVFERLVRSKAECIPLAVLDGATNARDYDGAQDPGVVARMQTHEKDGAQSDKGVINVPIPIVERCRVRAKRFLRNVRDRRWQRAARLQKTFELEP
jgi:hypothetical protein